jgi:3-phosphoshikimate 1-carboxyvinyltransferase
MLEYFGAKLSIKENIDGSHQITLIGQPELTGRHVIIPGDISSASFLIVAALITPGSNLKIQGVGINPLRVGIIDTLKEMGANLKILNKKNTAGEPVADIHVRHSQLKGVKVPAARAPSMIDEYPILSIAASAAEGTSIFEGIRELRVKESDRLDAMAKGLKACGIHTENTESSLTIFGIGSSPEGGNTITTHLDHRIAMSYLVLGLISKHPITIDDGSPIDTSFPGFIELMNTLGANMEIIK